jgi:phosphoribosyl 1,2-cyclic phosphodiesterase
MHFRTYASSSGGNCVALWTSRTAIMIDCGLGSMRRTRAVLAEHCATAPRPSAVLVSHLHGDHIGYYPLRVLEEAAVAVRVHEGCVEELRQRHYNGYGFGSLEVEPFAGAFSIGDLDVEPIALSHHPAYPTFGFVVRCGCGGRRVKAVIATDFNRAQDVLPHLVDADFVFIESNHDLELLKRYYNPNSRYHMANPGTAEVLAQARMQSRRGPRAVMLGHLSPQRNEPAIAVRTIESHFRQFLVQQDFALYTAPASGPSPAVAIEA